MVSVAVQVFEKESSRRRRRRDVRARQSCSSIYVSDERLVWRASVISVLARWVTGYVTYYGALLEIRFVLVRVLTIDVLILSIIRGDRFHSITYDLSSMHFWQRLEASLNILVKLDGRLRPDSASFFLSLFQDIWKLCKIGFVQKMLNVCLWIWTRVILESIFTLLCAREH